MLDSFTSLMCIESWGQSSFARCLIEVKVDETLKDSVTMGIPLPDGMGFTKETVRVNYEWKPPCCEQCKIFGHIYDQCLKNATFIPTVDKMNNDSFLTVVSKRKSGKIGSTNNNRSGAVAGKATWKPIKPKVRYEPKAHRNLPKNGVPKVSTFSKDDPSKKQ
ncbi:zinc knuckle CX2CX4HX4C containing protein, partial [Tanacetum coccineum]